MELVLSAVVIELKVLIFEERHRFRQYPGRAGDADHLMHQPALCHGESGLGG